jgi:hypothetical protein
VVLGWWIVIATFKFIQYTHICPDWPRAPPSLLHKGCRLSFPQVKKPASWRYRPPPPPAEVKERVELYLNSPSRSAWPVPGWTLPFTLYTCNHWQQVLELSVVLIQVMLPFSSENLVREIKEPWGTSLTFLFVLMHDKIWPPLSEIPCMVSISFALSPTVLNGISYEIQCLTRAHFVCFSFHIRYREFLI